MVCVLVACGVTGSADDDLTSASWWLNRAIVYADQIPVGEDRSEAHYKLATTLANEGAFAQAVAAAAEVSKPQIQVYAFSRIATLAHERGDEKTCDSALGLAREVALTARVGQTNAHMVRAFFALNRSDLAFPFADALPHPTQRLFAFTNVAEELGKAGRIDEAIKIVRDQQPPTWHESGIVAIARACAEAERFDDAIRLAATLTEKEFMDNANDRIAERLILAGELQKGKAFIEKITDRKRRDTRMAQWLEAAVAGDAATKSIAEAMSEANSREEKVTIGMLKLKQLVRSKDVAQAEKWLESLVTIIEESPQEPQVSKFGSFDDSLAIATIRAVYMDTAAILMAEGNDDAAAEHIKRAFLAAKGIKSQGLGKSILCGRLVQQLTALGDVENAQELAATLDTDYTKATASADVAASLILDGKIDEGLKMAKVSVADRSMGYGTKRVAMALLEVQAFDELGTYMATMPDGPREVRAFREVAHEFVRSRNTERLHGLLKSLPSDAARVQACLGASDLLREP